MKKIGISFFFFFLFLTNCFAEKINYRSNLLMDYPYYDQDKKEIFNMRTNNITEKLIYTMDPSKTLDYDTDYEKLRNAFFLKDEKIQNKIKQYIRITEEAKDIVTKINYYVVTQELIWTTFHPEITIHIENNELEKYRKELQEKMEIIPSWIKNYEIQKELVLEKKKDYKLTTKDCQIKEESEKWVITNCNSNATIKVEETKEEELFFYLVNGTRIGIESGFSPCTWYFNIILKEEETKKPEQKNDQDKKEENDKLNNNIKKENQLEKYPIYHVPNTKENQSSWIEFILLLILGLNLRKKL